MIFFIPVVFPREKNVTQLSDGRRIQTRRTAGCRLRFRFGYGEITFACFGKFGCVLRTSLEGVARGNRLKLVLSAFILAVGWTVALFLIARSAGLHSTPGIWLGVFGLPGVVIANWTQTFILHSFNTYAGYAIMFLVNWIFYCSVILGLVSMKRSLLRF